jgi:general secretion pathway protein B
MSYILEALKKAERKRELEERPRSAALTLETAEPVRRRRIWPYLLIAVLLANAILLARWSWNGSSGEATRPAPEPMVNRSDTQPPPSSGLPSEAEEHTAPNVVNPVRQVEKKKPEEPADRTPPKPETLEPVTKVPTHTEKPAKEEAAAKETPVLIGKDYPPASRKLYSLTDLPPEIRNSLPEFRISGHAYSPEARTRVVRINEKILQEGQDLSTGLKLDEITPDGVILTYQGFRFRVGINRAR